MKSYAEYLKDIQDREFEKNRPAREAAQIKHDAHKKSEGEDYMTVCACFSYLDNLQGPIDVSVEIMGMMMSDFLVEYKEINAKKL